MAIHFARTARFSRRLQLPLLFALACCLSLPSAVTAAPADADRDELSQWKLPAVQFPASNPYSEAKAELGKQLFFDPRLNRNHIACADCHHPGLNWSDGLPMARVNRQIISRHTPSLINVAYYPLYFWDGRADTLEAAIGDHIGGTSDPSNIPEAVEIVRSFQQYQKEFINVFGNKAVNAKEILEALATFVRTLTVTNTAFDRWVDGDESAISEQAKRGFALFTGKAGCVSCHTPPYFSDFAFHRTGSNSIDPGRFEVTGKRTDQNAFRTPQLRQVKQTAPYMHAGQKSTLRDVILSYTNGEEMEPGNGDHKTPELSAQEINDLLAFLASLSGPPVAVTVPILPIE